MAAEEAEATAISVSDAVTDAVKVVLPAAETVLVGVNPATVKKDRPAACHIGMLAENVTVIVLVKSGKGVLCPIFAICGACKAQSQGRASKDVEKALGQASRKVSQVWLMLLCTFGVHPNTASAEPETGSGGK